jgi:hypothetical protein
MEAQEALVVLSAPLVLSRLLVLSRQAPPMKPATSQRS